MVTLYTYHNMARNQGCTRPGTRVVSRERTPVLSLYPLYINLRPVPDPDHEKPWARCRAAVVASDGASWPAFR
jgi:hypothetical protein